MSGASQIPGSVHAFSVDVEDYYQVSVFRKGIAREEWPKLESRVEANTERVMAALAARGVRGTFFVLGCVAERHPQLVRRIVAAGHELASHGYSHERLLDLPRAAVRDELVRSRLLLEDLGGVAVRGFRAPSFSITSENLWALDELVDAGYAYDSSIFPIGRPDYGIADAPRDVHRAKTPSGREIVEFPLTVSAFMGRAVPVAGGGYFRLFPLAVTRWGFRRATAERRSGVFYMHPWEIDPGQPDLRPHTSRLGAFRHYTGLAGTLGKLDGLLAGFRFAPLADVLVQRGLLVPARATG